MNDRAPDAAQARFAVEHDERVVERLPEGGFTVRGAGRATWRIIPSREGWTVEGVEDAEGWMLCRSEPSGFILRARDGKHEIGRSMPLVGVAPHVGPRYVLLDDGRLFRVQARGARDVGFELLGWEMPGAYIEARPRTDSWVLLPTPASSGLQDIRALTLLFAAEILDAEETLMADET